MGDADHGPAARLPEPAFYFPIARGRYEVKPGLSALGTEFGNGAADARVFQIDRDLPRYREGVVTARGERLSKYYGTHQLAPLSGPVTYLIVERLCEEYPAAFRMRALNDGGVILHCSLTDEALRFDAGFKLLDVDSAIEPGYVDALDALAAQVPEDLAVVRRGEDGGDWLAALHVCAPNYWAPEDKLGKPFAPVHAPVAGIEPINRNAGAMVSAMIDKGPYVRFTWGLTTDTRLNHHPEPPPGRTADEWHGRRFDPADPRLYLRIERQVTWGLPHLDCALFAIRTYVTDCRWLEPAQRHMIAEAVRSMTPEQLEYKGLADSRSDVVEWLERNGT